MCDISPKIPKPKLLPEKKELPAEAPKPVEIGSKKEEKRPGNPFRIDLASTSSRSSSGAQV